ncbi:hypothetical protein FUAX_24020 [Fulvitalea axinellae]|uniref:Uncharacterized protein n=1 Tax=Fulvitalea axinellae TaxID=1182444 RepID=A0AAU9DG29_9BACT|nr:hypothetical protein FUAX_24020 [Fulvitalea axinellae]
MSPHYLRYQRLTFLLAISFLFGACNALMTEDLDGVQLKTSIALPMGETQYTIENLLDQMDDELAIEEKEIGGKKVLQFAYEQDLATVDLGDIVSVPNQSFPANGFQDIEITPVDIPVPIDLTLPLQVGLDESWDMDFGGNKLDEARFKSGVITIELASTVPVRLDADFDLPSLKTGTSETPFSRHISLEPFGTQIIRMPLAGNKFLFTDENIGVRNQLQFSFSNFVLNFTSNTTVQAGSALRFRINVANVVPDVFLGRFAKREISLDNQSIDIDVFDNELLGNVFFADPTLSLIVDNGIGLYMAADIRSITGISSNGTFTEMDGTFFNEDNPHEILRPSTKGQQVETVISLNKSNSNLPDFLSKMPKRLMFDAKFLTGTGEDDNLPQEFIDSNTTLGMKARAELPLDLALAGFTYTNTAEAEDFDEEDAENIEEALLKITTSNKIPIGMKLQINFLDAQKKQVATLFDENTDNTIIKAAQTGSDGFVTEATKQEARIYMGRELIDKLPDVKHYEIVLTIETGGSDPVKFEKSNTIDIQLAVQAKFKVNEDI